MPSFSQSQLYSFPSFLLSPSILLAPLFYPFFLTSPFFILSSSQLYSFISFLSSPSIPLAPLFSSPSSSPSVFSRLVNGYSGCVQDLFVWDRRGIAVFPFLMAKRQGHPEFIMFTLCTHTRTHKLWLCNVSAMKQRNTVNQRSFIFTGEGKFLIL